MEAVSRDVGGWVINPAVQRLWGQKLFEEAEEFWGLFSEYCLGTPLVSIPPLCSLNLPNLRYSVSRSLAVLLWGDLFRSVLKVPFCKGGNKVPGKPWSHALCLTVTWSSSSGPNKTLASLLWVLGPNPVSKW